MSARLRFLAERPKTGSLASLYKGSRWSQQKQGGWSRIYLFAYKTKNCSHSSASSGLKRLFLLYLHTYTHLHTYIFLFLFCFIVHLCVFSLLSEKNTPFSSEFLLVFSRTYNTRQFFFCCFSRAETKSHLLSSPTRFYFVLRKPRRVTARRKVHWAEQPG